MTNQAVWSRTAYPSATDFTFSQDRLTATNNSSGNFVVTNESINTGLTCYALEYPASGNFNGGFYTLASITGGGPYVGIWVTLAGTVYYGNGSGYFATGITIAAGSPGDQILFFIDWGVGTNTSGTKQIWIAPVHAGTVGEWNGSPTANPLTATGGYPITWTMTSFIPGVWFYGSLTGTMALISNTATLPGGQSPGNYLGLPISQADQILLVNTLVAIENNISVVNWTCNSGPCTGPITYSLNGGTQTSALLGGSTSGTSGYFYIPTFANSNINTIVIQDSSYTTDTSANFLFAARPPGNVLINQFSNPGGSETFTLSSNSSTISFSVSFAELYDIFGDGTGFTIQFNGLSSTNILGANIICTGSPSSPTTTLSVNGGLGGAPTTTIVGTAASMNGFAAITQTGSTIYGSFSCLLSDGTTFNSSSYTFSTNASASVASFTGGTVNGHASRGAYVSNIAVTTPVTGETITITGAHTNGGSTDATISGTYSGANLQYAQLSFDSGTFTDAGTFSTTGTTSGSFTAVSTNIIAYGTHSVILKDAVSGNNSNSFTFSGQTNFARIAQSNPALSIFSNSAAVLNSDGTTISVNAAGCIAAISGTGKYVFGIQSNNNNPQQLGIFNAEFFTSDASVGYSGLSFNQANQVGYYNNSVGSGTLYDIPGSFANIVYYATDMTAKLVWLSVDGVNWYGPSGTARSIADVAAGTDGFLWSAWANTSQGMVVFMNYNGSGGVWVLINGENGFPFNLPSGYSALPATINITSIAQCSIGQPFGFNWIGGSLTNPLQGLLDGSTITLTGSTTGSGGLAYGPTFTDYLPHSFALIDPDYPVDGIFPIVTEVSNLGSALVNTGPGELSGNDSVTLSISGTGLTGINFAFQCAGVNLPFATLEPLVSFYAADNTRVFACGAIISSGTPITYSSQWQGNSGAPLSGFPSVNGNGDIYLVGGSIALFTNSGNVYGNFYLNANGTTITANNVLLVTGSTSDNIAYATVSMVDTSDNDVGRYSLSVYNLIQSNVEQPIIMCCM